MGSEGIVKELGHAEYLIRIGDENTECYALSFSSYSIVVARHVLCAHGLVYSSIIISAIVLVGFFH